MHPEPTAAPSAASLPIRAGVLVLAGQQIRLTVKHGRLHASDTHGRESRSGEYARATCPFRRLVILGSGGYVSLDAIEWLADLKIPLIHLHPSGRLLLSSGHRGLDDARLRRLQAQTTPHSPLGVEVAREVLRLKLDGQAALLARLPGGDAAERAFEVERAALTAAATVEELRLAEARAAAVYWQAWTGTRIRFATRDARRIPPGWCVFTTRSSPLTGTPRLAGDVANCLLNYCYTLAELEARLALVIVGLDPALGVLHLDTPNRDSLAADVMEAVRPSVDQYVLDLVEGHVFTRRDFHETRRGHVRILPPLTHHLAATTTTWAQRIAPIAEHIAHTIAHQAGLRPPPTPLTGRQRRQARARINRPDAHRPSPPTPPAQCEDCGRETAPGRRRCTDCHAVANAERLRTQQADEITRRRSTGDHPSARVDVRDRISLRQEDQWRRRKATTISSGYTGQPAEFLRLIQPQLAEVAPSVLARATGLSTGYCAQIRAGKRIPHPRHWAALQLVGLQAR